MPLPVVVVDYDPTWPTQFATLRDRAASALGDLAAAIEHVGSTSVPGLAAKPIIDLDILLRDPAGLPEAIQRLAALGYAHLGDLGIAAREAFRQPPDPIRHNLYVCYIADAEYRRHILFRNHLRANPDDARAYGDLKRDLAARYTNDRDAYTEAKTAFVEGILARASAER
jgi:GrpB-like predicted nucleotidyltransferase (UPF0157 family)